MRAKLGAGRGAPPVATQRPLRCQFDRVDDSDYTFVYQPRFRIPADTLASIIIPTKDKADLLEALHQSIHRHTTGMPYKSPCSTTAPGRHPRLLRAPHRKMPACVLPAHIPSNWSRLQQHRPQPGRGQVLVFLNNDTEVITPDWLQRLAEIALLPDVATVAPLLYPDHTIQRAGVVVGMGGWADHVFQSEPLQHYPTPSSPAPCPCNVLANTGACVAIAAERFDTLGGFDEAFEICGSDVELGIRAQAGPAQCLSACRRAVPSGEQDTHPMCPRSTFSSLPSNTHPTG